MRLATICMVWFLGSALLAGGALRLETRSDPDLLGRHYSVIMDERGQQIGSVETQSPDTLGRRNSVVRNRSGRIVARATTDGTADALGRVRTVFRDPSGRALGVAETRMQPDAIGQLDSVFRDPSGQMAGRARTRPPDAMGRWLTRIEGESPFDLARPEEPERRSGR